MTIGAGCVVGHDTHLEDAVVPPRSHALGAPTTVVPHTNPDEFADGIRRGVATYVANSARYLPEMERIG